MSGQLRREAFEIEIRAPRDEVWHALTTGEGLARWVVLAGEVEPGVGGRVLRSWGEGQDGHGVIDEWEEGSRLVMHATGADGGEAPFPMLEEWTLEHTDGVTRVRLIHSLNDGGAESWEEDYGDFRRGWTLFLESLRHALEREPGRSRVSSLQLTYVDDPPVAAWRLTLDALGLDADPATGEHTELAGGAADVIVAFPGRSLLVVFDDGSTLFADLEGPEGQRWVYALAATFGPDTPERAARRHELLAPFRDLPRASAAM
jgi:uncharacterized protein YndB with AHSA1/START domain